MASFMAFESYVDDNLEIVVGPAQDPLNNSVHLTTSPPPIIRLPGRLMDATSLLSQRKVGTAKSFSQTWIERITIVFKI